MTHDDLIARLKQELTSWASDLTFRETDTPAETVTDSDNAIADTTGDTGWVLPLDDSVKIKWFKDRAKRHMLFYLLTGNARKFQSQAFALQHRFDHLYKMIQLMDEAWEKFKEENASAFMDNPAWQFGAAIGTGLVYDIAGNDVGTDDDVELRPEGSA